MSDLRQQLSRRGLSTDGLKAELVNRLQARLDEEEFGLIDDVAPSAPADPPVEPVVNIVPVVPKEQPVVADTISATVVEAVKDVKNDTLVAPDSTSMEKNVDIKEPLAPPSAPLSTEEQRTAVAEIPASAPKPEESSTKVVTSTMSVDEKKAARAARFGLVSEKEKKSEMEQKRIARAARFGIVTEEGKKAEIEQKKAARAQRFGIVSEEQKKQVFEEKRVNRAERFGIKPGDKRSNNKNEKDEKKRQKTDEKKPLLSKEEIQTRLKRCEKFNAMDSAEAFELKSMLRKYRFQTA